MNVMIKICVIRRLQGDDAVALALLRTKYCFCGSEERKQVCVE